MHTPEPVHDFLARFLAKPDTEALRALCLDLLDLELCRAQSNTLPASRTGEAYGKDVSRALRVLHIARRRKWHDRTPFDPAWFWLTLLGNRLAVERGLSVGGLAALAEVASRRLNLPLAETRTWSCDELFERYTRTGLRTEWDYPGLRFRIPVET